MEIRHEYIISDGYDGTPNNIDYSVAKSQLKELRFWGKQLRELLNRNLLTFCEEFPNQGITYDLYFYWRITEGTGVSIPVLKFIGATEENIWALRTLYVNAESGHV